MLISVALHAQYNEGDLLEEAESYFEQGKYAQAMPLYSQLLSLNPTKPEFNYKYGATALYGDASKKEEAIKYLRYASTKTGIAPDCWYFLGRAYHLNYQFADAINAYKKYQELGDKKIVEERKVDREIESCQNGKNLLSNIKDVVVLDKKQTQTDAFFRIYDLSDIGGKILVTPEELLSTLDVKNNHQSLIHFRGAGTSVYFSSYGKDGKNGLDIYRAEVLPGGTFSSPERVGGFVNSPYDEDYPFLHPDGQTFYFSSKGHSSMGGYDIFKSSYDANLDVFSKPENLDFAVNTPDDELLYIADSAKVLANFASARSSRQGELHVYKVEVNSAPVDLTLVKGTFDNQVDSKDNLAQITVIDAATNRQVDVQYTDPVTGSYLLSFPKSGRYKFIVEASNSNQVHTGIVVIPMSTGINAYLQEMDLVLAANTEKLLINNLFDQFYDGDISELAQKLLKQKATLDVNFDANDDVIPVLSTEETEDIAKAAGAAGFDAGMTNESVVANSEARQNELAERKQDIAQLKAGAIEKYNENVAIASEQAAMVEGLIAQAEGATGDEKNRLMFEASIEKMKAQESIKIAKSAKALSADLEKLEQDVEKTHKAAVDQTVFLKAGIASGDYATAVNALKAEKAWAKNNSTEITNYDVLDLTQAVSIDSRNEAQKSLTRASALRADADEVQNKLITRRRQAQLAKGKKAKELEAEVALLEQESTDLNQAAQSAYVKAEKYEAQALEKRQQYDIVVGLTESYLDEEMVAAETAQINPNTEREYQSANDRLAGVKIDQAAVASYVQDHPEAMTSFGNDQEAMAFKRAYLGADTSKKLDGLESGMAVAETENLNDLRADNESNAASAEGISNSESQNEKAGDTPQESQSDKQSGKGDVAQSRGVNPAIAAVPVVIPNIGSEKDNSADATADNVATNNETGAASDDLATNNTADSETNSTETESNPDIAEADSQTNAESVVTPEDVDAFLNPYEGKSTEEKIESEKAEVKAAEDWIEIIDSSIEEMKAESNGKPTPEDKEQIRKYEELKSGKRGEIIARQERIEDWQEEENTSLANASKVLKEAKEDVNSLDPSYVARLESKISSTYVDRRYLGQIQNLNSSYLSEMTMIELSGKSNAEIAQDRIAENESFLMDVSRELDSFELSQDKRDMLVELRRVKTLEIDQDRAMLSGQMDFVPRTTEGRQSQTIADVEQAEIDIYNPEALASLSPQMKSDLQMPYSRELVLTDYENRKTQIEAGSVDIEMREQRLELNKSYLSNLQSEIQMYAQAVKNVEGEAGTEALTNRYEVLLSERSTIIDEINTDKTKIAFAEAAVIAEQRRVEAEETNPEIVEADPKQDYVMTFDSLYRAELKSIEAKGLEGELEIRAIADANTKVVSGIDIAIASLTQELDDTKKEKKRDELQIEIQRLDAISADKRQEADRLNAEADQIKLASEVAENQEDQTVENNAETTVGIETVPVVQTSDINDLKESISTTQINVNEVNYKSLNANIALNSIKPLVADVNAKKLEAQTLFNDFESTDDPAEQEVIKEKLIVLQSEIQASDEEIVKEFAKSNAPEIAFYANENAEILSRIESSNAGIISEEDKRELAQTSFELEKNLGELNTSFEKSEITEIERIERETILLGKMSVLNESLSEQAKLLDGEEIVLVDSTTNQTADNIDEQPSNEIVVENFYSEQIPVPVQAVISKPENFVVKSGSEYVTPVSESFYTEMTEEDINQLVANDELLNVDLEFTESQSREEENLLLEKTTAIDLRGLELMSNSPNQLNYLLAAVRADSLKTIEQDQGRYAGEMTMMATEELKEVERLRKAALSESNEKDKQDIMARADKIELTAINHFQRGSIAAKKAEEMREMRKREEKELSEMARLLAPQQKAELDAILNNKTYRIIPADLTAEGENPVVTKREDNPIASESSITESAASSPVKGSGNWLEMVEVIAEKEDFSDVVENMFVQVDAPVYSARRPIPIDPEMPSGLIFQVQVGAFRKPIPQDLFAEFAPVMGQKLDNGITRYRAGIFKVYKDAVTARNSIREMGYSDAFVVIYLDGEKLSAAQVQDILAQVTLEDSIVSASQSSENVTPETISSSESPANSNQSNDTAADYYNNPDAAEAAQVEVTPGLFFTVQVGVYSKPVKLEALYNLSDLNSELTASGVIRYTTGRFASVQDASQRKVIAREKGVTDAFVTAYYNGKRISLSEAEQILLEEGNDAISPIVNGAAQSSDTTNEEIPEDIEYIVIIGSFEGDIPQDLANLFLERSDLNIKRVEGPNGSSMYVSEAFDSLQEAQTFLDSCFEAGIDSALLGQMKDGEIISISNR